jgi:hypothetical protein
MRPTTLGSVRTMTSLGGMLYTGGTDSLLRTWHLEHPERSLTVSRGLEPSPPYSMTSPGVVAEALPAAVDLVTMGGGWIDVGGDAADEPAGSSNTNGSPLHSDAIECVSIISVTPGGFGGNRSFSGKGGAAAQAAAAAAAGMGPEPDQLHICTGSRDGSVALWRNSE